MATVRVGCDFEPGWIVEAGVRCKRGDDFESVDLSFVRARHGGLDPPYSDGRYSGGGLFAT